MDPITQQTTLAAAGGKKDPLYVDDVFSTFLYEGTGSARTITNGIDNSDKSLVWIKQRNAANSHALQDTVRGTGVYLASDTVNPQIGLTTRITSFNSDGFTTGSSPGINGSGNDYVAWNFKAEPGFFDVVTYTGNGTAGRTVAHNLGSVPGFMVVKKTSGNSDWLVYHQGLSGAAQKTIQLNESNTSYSDSTVWNNTNPTASVFTVGTSNDTNQSGSTYVAYLLSLIHI